ncbi:hypothetical protein BDF14DRAFT_1776644 [Spinellus fusiger]|nr:hypothetical protein BDF14DRAFT_1776644 [Spinellus fusiger]
MIKNNSSSFTRQQSESLIQTSAPHKSYNDIKETEATTFQSRSDPEIPMTIEEDPKLTRSVIIRQLRSFGLMLIIDIGLPLAIYYVVKMYTSILIALIVSGIPPFLNVIITFIRKRRVDILGVIFVLSFIISAVLSIVSGDARLALLRDSATTAIISGMFLLTLIPLRTSWIKVYPLTFLIHQQATSELSPIQWIDETGEAQSMSRSEWCWTYVRLYRVLNYTISALWGIFLMGEFVAKVIMIRSTLTIDQIVLYGNIIVICIVVTLCAVSLILTRRVTKIIITRREEWRKVNDFTGRL